MAATFSKAVKSKAKARIALYGPSGSGKTFSALRIAKGLGGKVAVIDSEHGSASKYADRFDFDSCELHEASIVALCDALKSAAEGGYNVVILDSLSHAWQELLAEVEKLTKAKYKGNTWSAWSEGTPKQRTLVKAMLAYPGHIIATMRAKTEWSQEDSGNGKTRPVRVGLAPEQGKGIEYEFDLLVSITPEHHAFIEKDRSGKFQDQMIEKPGEEFGAALAAWLSEGAEPPKKILPDSPDAGAFADFTQAVLNAKTEDDFYLAVRSLAENPTINPATRKQCRDHALTALAARFPDLDPQFVWSAFFTGRCNLNREQGLAELNKAVSAKAVSEATAKIVRDRFTEQAAA